MLRNELFLFIAYKLEGKGWFDEPTVYGITEKNYPSDYSRIKSLVDNNAGKDLINNAIIDAYEKIYKQSYADKMLFPLNWIYFDFYFNSGLMAAKTLQLVLNQKWHTKLAIDGIVGPKTIHAVETVLNTKEKLMLFSMQYTMERIRFVSTLKYCEGLINRIAKLNNKIWEIAFSEMA